MGTCASPSDARYTTGIPGKGPNPLPASIFAGHELVQYVNGGQTYWLDPSYGNEYAATDGKLGQQLQSSIAGYCVIVKVQFKDNTIGYVALMTKQER